MIKNTKYHDNGNKCEEGFYKNGRREGECIIYYGNCSISTTDTLVKFDL